MFKRMWASTVHVVAGLVVSGVIWLLILNTAVFALTIAVTVVGAPYGRDALRDATRIASWVQRKRFVALLGEELNPAPAVWQRQAWYHFLVAPVLATLGFSLLVTFWTMGVVAALLAFFGRSGTTTIGVRPAQPFAMTGLLVLSVVMLALALRAARVFAALETRITRAMFELSLAEELAQRVEVLTESRAEVVDAADAERRRIERDLHDGAQQRLVSLAMNLGMARANLTGVDERAQRAIAQAHDEAKLALTELRELVRGLHPAVLDDRGLDAALSGIVARLPVPARLTVDVPVRPSRTVEAVAYFVVSEALSNVVKHAHAQSVEVAVKREESLLRIEIRDDGRGGADPSGGTGLTGLGQRVSSVDGTLQVSSPIGGPTVITVELPCES